MVFLFDAQMPVKLAHGLEIIDQDNTPKNKEHEIYHADALLGQGAKDPEVIEKAKELNAIIVSEDDDFKRIKSNKALIKQYKLGYVLYKPPTHGARYWEKVCAFILAWEDLKKKISQTEKPFIFKIDKKGNIQIEFF